MAKEPKHSPATALPISQTTMSLDAAVSVSIASRRNGGKRTPPSMLLSAAAHESLLQNNEVVKKLRSARRLWSGDDDDTAERRAVSRVRQALAKKVAKRMLELSKSSAKKSNEKVLRCCCRRLPTGLQCALHQSVPEQSWMAGRGGGGAPSVWYGGKAVAPKACARGGRVFSEYARWRRNVWMPSRFYLEHVEASNSKTGTVRSNYLR